MEYIEIFHQQMRTSVLPLHAICKEEYKSHTFDLKYFELKF